VHSRTTLDRLREVAADQWGLVTRRQVESAGVSDTTLERLTAPGRALTRIAFGVYQLAGAPIPDHVDLRAAWLQLAPGVGAWDRSLEQGVVSHRSAAALFELGHLPADVHEFTVPGRRQTRRPDVKIHVRYLDAAQVVTRRQGLPTTRPARIVSDLVRDREDPEAIAQIIVDAILARHEHPGAFAAALAAQSHRFGLAPGDGLAALGWLLDLVAPAADAARWTGEARASLAWLAEQDEPRARTSK
jgi:hypothetical protein